jgi:hypothetical protein
LAIAVLAKVVADIEPDRAGIALPRMQGQKAFYASKQGQRFLWFNVNLYLIHTNWKKYKNNSI